MIESENIMAPARPVNLPKASLWQELKNAIRGSDADYTKISMKKAVFLLAVPMILELVMESTFAVVDIYFVGKLGASAVATVGLTETYLFLLYSLAMGLATAVTAKSEESAFKFGTWIALAKLPVPIKPSLMVPRCVVRIERAPRRMTDSSSGVFSVSYCSSTPRVEPSFRFAVEYAARASPTPK